MINFIFKDGGRGFRGFRAFGVVTFVAVLIAFVLFFFGKKATVTFGHLKSAHQLELAGSQGSGSFAVSYVGSPGILERQLIHLMPAHASCYSIDLGHLGLMDSGMTLHAVVPQIADRSEHWAVLMAHRNHLAHLHS